MGEVRTLEKKVDRLEEVLIEIAVAQRRAEEDRREIRQLLRELSEAHKKTEEAQRRTEESLRELSRAHEETEEALRELSRAHEETEEALKELSKAHEETEKALRELSRAHEETEEALKRLSESQDRFQAEFERMSREMNRRWAELSDRLGTLAEDILAPGIPYLLERLGYRVKSTWTNEKVRLFDGTSGEFDVVAVAEKDGREVLFLCEVKSKLREKHFEQLRNQCRLYREHGIRRDLPIIPVLAALNIPDHLINYANKRGVLLVKMGGDYLEALNPEVIG